MPRQPIQTTPRCQRDVARSVLASTSAQMAARGIHLILNIGLSLALIRYFGPARYGDYVFVITVTMLFGLLADFGLPKLAVRDIVREDAAAPAVIGTLMAVRLGLSVLAAVGVQATVWLLGGGPALRLAAAVGSLLFFAESLLSVVVIFHVRLRQQYEAFIRVAMETTETLTAFWLIVHHASVVAIMVGTAGGAAVGVVLALILARQRFGLHMVVDRQRVGPLLREALPVGGALLVGVAYLKLDSVMLVALRSRAEVGIYGAAYQPVEYLLLASPVIINVLFPLLTRWHGVDPERFRKVYRWGAEGLLGLTLPIAVLTALFAPPVVQRFYLKGFLASAQPLRVLTFALVFMIINTWQSFVLLAGDHQLVTLRYDAVALALNITLNLLMVWRFGYMGAAATALVTAVFVTACSTRASARLLGATLDGGRVARIAAANALLGATGWAAVAAGLPWWAALTVAAASYPLWVQLCGVLGLQQVRWVHRSLRAGAGPLGVATPTAVVLSGAALAGTSEP